jgi:crotonobetaine/carnitine-CoA ligase
MILAGGRICLFPTFSLSRFWGEVAATKATVFVALPNVLNLLMSAPARDDDAANSLSVGLIAAVAPDLQTAFEDRFGVTLKDTYGMTEVEPLTLPVPDRRSPPGSCGKAGRDFEVAVLDPQDKPVPPLTSGQVAARPRAPAVMMLGYEDDAEATVAAWRNLWFHTGDLGYLDESGFLFVEGRLKDMIRRGGENISTWELEGLIAEHPDVELAAVVGVPSPLGEEEVKAIVVPREGARPEPAELHAYCRQKMARFMVPRFIELRTSLPHSDIGKVQRELLKGTEPPVWDAKAAR